jgi:activator of HSP90 ATPase
LFTVAKLRLPKVLETKLSSFPGVIIDVHGKDLTVSADPSRSGTPAPGTSTSAPIAAVASSSSSTPVEKPKARVKNVNSATVVVEADFQASAEDLFGLLTDAKRIPAWTRAPAEVSPLMFLGKYIATNVCLIFVF